MKNPKLKEAGFGAVGIAIAVATVVLIGLIGARVFMTTTSKKETPTHSAHPTSQNTQSPSKAPVVVANYLDIKELGVKFKLNEQVKDAVYALQTLDDGSLVAQFSTQSLAASDPACDAHSGQLGALDMSVTDTNRLGNKLIPDGQTVFKFGDLYYTYVGPQALCSDSVKSMVDAKLAAFRESLKTLQVDK